MIARQILPSGAFSIIGPMLEEFGNFTTSFVNIEKVVLSRNAMFVFPLECIMRSTCVAIPFSPLVFVHEVAI